VSASRESSLIDRVHTLASCLARAALYAKHGGHRGLVLLQRSEWRQVRPDRSAHTHTHTHRHDTRTRRRMRSIWSCHPWTWPSCLSTPQAVASARRRGGDSRRGHWARRPLAIYNNPSGYLAICGGRCHLLMIPASPHSSTRVLRAFK
jgi:hypothetical protein